MHGLLDPRSHAETCTGPLSDHANISGSAASDAATAESSASDSDSSAGLFCGNEHTWMAELPDPGADVDGGPGSDSRPDNNDNYSSDSGSDSDSRPDNNDDGSSDSAPDWPLGQESDSDDWDIDLDEEPSTNHGEPGAMSFEDFCDKEERQVLLLQWIRKNKIPRYRFRPIIINYYIK